MVNAVEISLKCCDIFRSIMAPSIYNYTFIIFASNDFPFIMFEIVFCWFPLLQLQLRN